MAAGPETRALAGAGAPAPRSPVPNPRSGRIARFAATALVQGLTALTRNTAGFPPSVPLLNPWRP